jgi:hypothetical protein
MTTTAQKITFGEMRASGVRDVLIYETNDGWPAGSRRVGACATARPARCLAAPPRLASVGR